MDRAERSRLRRMLSWDMDTWDSDDLWTDLLVFIGLTRRALDALDAADQGRVLAVVALTRAMNDHLAAISERDAARAEAARLRGRIDALRDAMRTARDEALAGADLPMYRRSARLEGVADRLQQWLKLDAAEDARAALAAADMASDVTEPRS